MNKINTKEAKIQLSSEAKTYKKFVKKVKTTNWKNATWLVHDRYNCATIVKDPDNYRDITLLSSLGKLFTVCINSRFNNYLEAGFCSGYSTLDHIFVLHSLIDIYIQLKKEEDFIVLSSIIKGVWFSEYNFIMVKTYLK